MRFILLIGFQLITLLVAPFGIGNAQLFSGIDIETVNVDQLTDDQIKAINSEIESQGLSIPDALELAKVQGLPENEATKLQFRLMQLQTETNSTSTLPPSGDQVVIEPDDRTLDSMTPTSGTDSGPTIVIKDEGTGNDIYGHSIFTDQTLDIFTTTDGARAPDWYVLGTGDQVRISIFGVSQTDLFLEISDDGFVQPSGGQRIFVKGLTIKEAKTILQNRLSELYTFQDDEFALTIRAARTITINIFGESRANGGFTISALNTAFNALTVAGGVTSAGTVRNIQLIRGDVRNSIDVYEFLTDPTIQSQYTLRHNDIIFVPVAEKIVSISGAVRRPMRYELIDDEGLKELIEYAGGTNYNTATDFVQIQRIVDNEPVLLEYNLQDILNGVETVNLNDGDRVQVRPIAKELEKFVTIEGSVFYPGNYDINKNQTLFDLIDRAQIKPQAMTEQIFIERKRLNNTTDIIPVKLDSIKQITSDIILQNEDNVIIFDKERYRVIGRISVLGDVRNPFERNVDFDERLTIREALNLAGGLQPTSSNIAYIFKTNLFNPDIKNYIRVNLNSELDRLLVPGEALMVYNNQNYTDIGNIILQGNVSQELDLNYDSSLTIKDLLTMANGLQRTAALNNIEVFRLNLTLDKGTDYEVIKLEVDEEFNLKSPSNFKLQPFDRIIVRRIPEFNFGATIEINGEIKYPGLYPIDGQKLRLTDVIRQAGGLTTSADPSNAIIFRQSGNVGPIGVDLAAALDNPNDPFTHNPVILENDIITIPEFENVIQVRINGTRYGDLNNDGLVTNNNALNNDLISTIYTGNKSAKWYIDNIAGGFGREADKWSVTITNPNGEVKGTKRRLFFFKKYPKVEPGSVITLRNKEPKPEKEGPVIDLDTLSNRTLQAATTLLTLLILRDQLTN